jgi:choline dehydrogenase-like flavoprotein
MNAPQYDAIIIGSGAGGAAAAYRLVRAGLRVALLEKGPRLPKDGSTLDIRRVVHQGEFLSREIWRDSAGREFAPEEHFNLGGKTKWYGAALLRFAPHEFAPDVDHGCLGWPIDYPTLAPYYDEAEELLTVRRFPIEPGLSRIVSRITRNPSTWTASPLPMGLAGGILHDAAEAAHFDGFASVRALKSDAEQSLLMRVMGDPRLTLLTNTEAVDLIGNPRHPARIIGVRTSDDQHLLGTHILLGAGALHSPRLLERYLTRSNLTAALPVAHSIGRNLKLHLLTAMVAVSARKQSDLVRKTTVLLNERYPHSSVQPLGFDAELIATLIPKLVPRALAAEIGKRAYGFFLQTEDGSDRRNRVLDGDGDGPPTLNYDASRTQPALREHRRFTRAFQRVLIGAGFFSFTQRIGLAGTAHACGTLPAGDDPAHAVVDANGSVFGMPGLYVVDGSVLPRSSRVNPSLTIYAWALRVAHLIASRTAVSGAGSSIKRSQVNHENV